MDGLNGDDYHFWVGARDLLWHDEVIWVQSGNTIQTMFWKLAEPDHNEGDCVYFDVIKGRLAMATCDMTMSSLSDSGSS